VRNERMKIMMKNGKFLLCLHSHWLIHGEPSFSTCFFWHVLVKNLFWVLSFKLFFEFCTAYSSLLTILS
jgi:hypothetical protein